MGKCPSCGKWNSFVEEIVEVNYGDNRDRGGIDSRKKSEVKVVYINDIVVDDEERYSTGMKEMDRVLGGGIVKGSLILVSGEPGIGKSTLLLQMCERTGLKGKILYVSGEESVNQIKLRANRLNIKNPEITMLCETNIRIIERIIRTENPKLVIIDSIQTIFNEDLASAPGTVSQVRESTAAFMRMAKTLNIPMIIVGHITKEGLIAGPKVLEHIVDAVLYFEGERHLNYRILRAIKNRFGSTNEIGIFEMRETGLEEVENPSLIMLSERPHKVPGSVVVASLEGTRPMLIEIQALVCPTNFGVPRRMTTGVDYNRVAMLMAVLEKRANLHLHDYDAYVNVVGGLKITEPACDLGIAAAIASSFINSYIDPDTILIGEIGLTGEIRAVSRIEARVNEAMRIGVKTCIIPSGNMRIIQQNELDKMIEIKAVGNIQEALDLLL